MTCTGLSFLGDLVFNRTYSKTKADGHKESWAEMCARIEAMHVAKYPTAAKLINESMEFMRARKAIGSARVQAFAGGGVEDNNARAYNCAYLAITELQAFAEVLYLLACGTGVGYSVQQQHIDLLPVITEGFSDTWVIPDTKEGWADSIPMLIGNPQLQFKYDLIRPAGSVISSGGTASGPDPLCATHEAMRLLLTNAVGRKLSASECADICCLIADAIICGSSRRSATIVLFDQPEMDYYKSGTWYLDKPYRARANVSRVLDRKTIKKAEFYECVNRTFDGLYGEPGVVWLNNPADYGVNPCVEIMLKDCGVCNLSEVVLSYVGDVQDFKRAAVAATVLGTLQAGYTEFKYLRPKWKINAENEALLGVSMTGQAMRPDLMKPEILEDVANACVVANAVVAKMIGIKPAKRITTTKPSGSTSAVHGCTSGIHPAFAEYYIRRVEIVKSSKLFKALKRKFGCHPVGSGMLIEDHNYNALMAVVCVPCGMPGAITAANETSLQLLERMKVVSEHWIEPGHQDGENKHNVSLTTYYQYRDAEGNRNTAELNKIIDWMWYNRACYTGISLFDRSDVKYTQAPFEAVTKEKYEELMEFFGPALAKFDFTKINYNLEDDTSGREFACSGGSCEIT